MYVAKLREFAKDAQQTRTVAAAEKEEDTEDDSLAHARRQHRGKGPHRSLLRS